MCLSQPKTLAEGKKSPREETTGYGAAGPADFRPPPLVLGEGAEAARRERNGGGWGLCGIHFRPVHL